MKRRFTNSLSLETAIVTSKESFFARSHGNQPLDASLK